MTFTVSLCNLILYSFGIIGLVIGLSLVKRHYCSKDIDESMNLEDFIAESIKQLMNGVTRPQETSEVVGGAVNPHLLSTPSNTDPVSISHGKTTEIKYHLALSKSKSKKGESKFSVMFGEYGGMGGKKIKQNSNSSLTTMSFSVRVSLPLHDNRATQNHDIEDLKAIQDSREKRSIENRN